VGIFPNDAAILLEQNDEWVVQRSRYKSLESVAGLSDNPVVSLPIMAA
jgi:putative transposase